MFSTLGNTKKAVWLTALALESLEILIQSYLQFTVLKAQKSGTQAVCKSIYCVRVVRCSAGTGKCF